jgi:hypothetical protein
MSASRDSGSELSGLLFEVVCSVAFVATGWYLRVGMVLSWPLTVVYALLVSVGLRSVLRIWTRKTSREGAVGVSLLVAVLLQFALKFQFGFSWPGSIAIGVAVLVVAGLVVAGLEWVRASVAEVGPIWAFGKLPGLEVKAPSAGRLRTMPANRNESLTVHINQQDFSLGDRFRADKLALAGFEEGGSVARVQAGALPGQTLLAAKHCVAKSFGGEFIVVTLNKESTSPSLRSVSAAFLFFREGLERISIVVAGGSLMIDQVTHRFAELAREMCGQPSAGARGQQIWRAGDCFLVCADERWKGLRRATFIWTSEDLGIP